MGFLFDVCKLILLRGVSMSSKEKEQSHYLLMALGVSSRQTTYKYKGRASRADCASIACLECVEAEGRPDTVLCLVPGGGRKKTRPIFSQEPGRMRLTAHPLDISDGDCAEELNKILVKVARAIERE